MWCRAFSIALDRLLRVYFRLISTITSDSNSKFRVPWTNYIKGSIPHFEFTEEFVVIKVLTKITIKHKTMMKCEVKSNIKIYKKLGSGWGPQTPEAPGICPALSNGCYATGQLQGNGVAPRESYKENYAFLPRDRYLADRRGNLHDRRALSRTWVSPLLVVFKGLQMAGQNDTFWTVCVRRIVEIHSCVAAVPHEYLQTVVGSDGISCKWTVQMVITRNNPAVIDQIIVITVNLYSAFAFVKEPQTRCVCQLVEREKKGFEVVLKRRKRKTSCLYKQEVNSNSKGRRMQMNVLRTKQVSQVGNRDDHGQPIADGDNQRCRRRVGSRQTGIQEPSCADIRRESRFFFIHHAPVFDAAVNFNSFEQARLRHALSDGEQGEVCCTVFPPVWRVYVLLTHLYFLLTLNC